MQTNPNDFSNTKPETIDLSNFESKKIALVTGATGGIGKACCYALSEAGFRIAVHYRTSDESALELKNKLPGSFLIKADLSKSEDIDHLYEILKAEGGLDVLVNNAGMTIDGPLLRAKLEDFDRVVDVNMRSTWYLTKKLSRMMARKSSGRIINISSVVGSTGNAYQTIYGMTKAAIDNFTKSCAAELAPFNIMINAVAPGFIETAMTAELPAEEKEKIIARIPLGKMGQPMDVAKMVRFLATEADYCTGSVFHVNGGMYGG
jgi:3-oxoacyl-[acyl-carrier protein] reductase